MDVGGGPEIMTVSAAFAFGFGLSAACERISNHDLSPYGVIALKRSSCRRSFDLAVSLFGCC